MIRHLTFIFAGCVVLSSCAKEQPPRTVDEFDKNPLLLEAAMVRCSENRSKTRYDAECVNARLAASRIQAREEAARKAELEARSERKREALRRTQAAAAEARRRAAEADRARDEAEYLSQFGLEPGETASAEASAPDPEAPVPANTVDAADAVNEPQPDSEPALSDLESVREELQRRNEQGSD
ncbi:MAG: EexN family lipoprotein [Woeseiaceae bacterium]|nr:EexN family lipoprotein [Woeseiaceae bacterium]